MAATTLALSVVSRAGFDNTAGGTNADNVNGMVFANNGDTYLRVKNTNASSCTVTLNFNRTVDGQTVTARTVTVGATTGDKIIGPFPTADWGTSVSVTFSVGGATTQVWALSNAG